MGVNIEYYTTILLQSTFKCHKSAGAGFESGRCHSVQHMQISFGLKYNNNHEQINNYNNVIGLILDCPSPMLFTFAKNIYSIQYSLHVTHLIYKFYNISVLFHITNGVMML